MREAQLVLFLDQVRESNDNPESSYKKFFLSIFLPSRTPGLNHSSCTRESATSSLAKFGFLSCFVSAQGTDNPFGFFAIIPM